MINNSINTNPSISFGAKFITTQNIKQLDHISKQYLPYKISIVQVDGKKESDVKAVYNAIKNWKNASYAQSIQGVLNSIFADFLSPEEFSVFAVTTQKKNHSKLNSKKILALAEVDTHRKDKIHLDYLQVDPSFMHTSNSRKYKGIGSCVLDFLKNNFRMPITLQSDFKVTDFYIKNKFDLIEKDKFNYQWIPENN